MSTEHDQFEENLPANLRSDLRHLFAHSPQIPDKTEVAILAAAAQRAAHIRRLRVTLRWSGLAAAVAAAVLISVHLWPTSKPTYRPGATVTILDAYSLARQLKVNAAPDKSWDINHDGVVDQRDVDQLANQAVSLKGSAQ